MTDRIKKDRVNSQEVRMRNRRKRFSSSKLRLREAELKEHPCGSELTAVSQAPTACHTAQYLGTWPHWDAGDERMEEWNVGASETPS